MLNTREVWRGVGGHTSFPQESKIYIKSFKLPEQPWKIYWAAKLQPPNLKGSATPMNKPNLVV